MSDTNSPRVSLEFHVPFENLFIRRLLSFLDLFVKNIFHVYVVRPYPFYLFPIATCIHICSFIKFPMFVRLSFLDFLPSTFRL